MKALRLFGSLLVVLVAGACGGLGLLFLGFSHGWDEGWIRIEEGSGDSFGWVLVVAGAGIAGAAAAVLGRAWRARALSVPVMAVGATVMECAVFHLLDRPNSQGTMTGVIAGAIVLAIGIGVAAATGMGRPATDVARAS